ncbi:MAG: DUF416 family protein [Hahellaceae bacterium]|nr:DUF416 family protein [Hahellaceae bacterium]
MKSHQFSRYVRQLKGWRETVFVLALAQRALPNYQLFSEAVQLEGADRVALCLSDFWAAMSERIAENRLIAWLDDVQLRTPLAEDYDYYGVHPACDFCYLIEQALLSQINPEKPRGGDAGERSLQTVMDFLEMSEGEGLSEYKLIKLFDRSPLMQRELEFQKELVYRLRKQPFPSAEFLLQMCEFAADDGVSNIGICLTEDEDESEVEDISISDSCKEGEAE